MTVLRPAYTSLCPRFNRSACNVSMTSWCFSASDFLPDTHVEGLCLCCLDLLLLIRRLHGVLQRPENKVPGPRCVLRFTFQPEKLVQAARTKRRDLGALCRGDHTVSLGDRAQPCQRRGELPRPVHLCAKRGAISADRGSPCTNAKRRTPLS